MKTISTPVGPVYYVESANDRHELHEWVMRQHTVALDTESTGLDIYASDWKLRMIQFATPYEAYVIPHYGWNTQLIMDDLVHGGPKVIMHNAGFDIRSLFPHSQDMRHRLWAKTTDTRILSHLVDPRGREEGGTGHSLEDLAKVYVPEAPKEGGALKDEFTRLKKAGEFDTYNVNTRLNEPSTALLKDRFRLIREDNEVFVRYAGMDAIITARLYKALDKVYRNMYCNMRLDHLAPDEHKLAEVMSEVDHQGVLLDDVYARKVNLVLSEREDKAKVVASTYGLRNINSTQQIAEALEMHGMHATDRTAKGNVSIGKNFLESKKDHPLVAAILEGKQAGKWRKTWVLNFLDQMDSSKRVHPSTNTLRARTARFSVTGIPAQTLPANDSMIRTCFVAEPGHTWVAVDYSNQELRYAAAVSGDTRMIQAFKNNDDLHLITAEAAFPGRGEEMRKYGKLTNFATLYGVGATGLSKQTGLSSNDCRTLLDAFRSSYPTLAGYGRTLAGQAALTGSITTRTGRRLPVDPSRSYSALNYYVQSGCRDVTAQAIMNLWDAGFGKYIRLAVHDELDFSLPKDFDAWFEIKECMETTVEGVELPVEIRVGDQSWGSLYSSADTQGEA